jgi:quinol monooxygenase YgiN
VASNGGGGRFDIDGTVPQATVRSAAVSDGHHHATPPADDLVADVVADVVADAATPEIELAIVTMRFDAADPGALLSILSKYVVLTRMQPGCRNVDLCASVTRPGRYLLIQKWESAEAQRVHFDSPVMVEMAQACAGILTVAPDIDLWDGPSAHDLA